MQPGTTFINGSSGAMETTYVDPSDNFFRYNTEGSQWSVGLGEYVFKEKKVWIGRSDFADIVVDDDFVSKMHAVLLLYSDALILLDLNSANGTTVNSIKVSKTILKNDDVISLGNHRLKVENAPVISAEMEELLKSPDTLKMKNLIDMRRQRARRQVQAAQNRNKPA